MVFGAFVYAMWIVIKQKFVLWCVKRSIDRDLKKIKHGVVRLKDEERNNSLMS